MQVLDLRDFVGLGIIILGLLATILEAIKLRGSRMPSRYGFRPVGYTSTASATIFGEDATDPGRVWQAWGEATISGRSMQQASEEFSRHVYEEGRRRMRRETEVQVFQYGGTELIVPEPESNPPTTSKRKTGFSILVAKEKIK